MSSKGFDNVFSGALMNMTKIYEFHNSIFGEIYICLNIISENNQLINSCLKEKKNCSWQHSSVGCFLFHFLTFLILFYESLLKNQPNVRPYQSTRNIHRRALFQHANSQPKRITTSKAKILSFLWTFEVQCICVSACVHLCACFPNFPQGIQAKSWLPSQ